MKRNLVSVCIKASDIQPGDYLDITGKTKVHAVRMIGQYFTVAHKTRGARSGNITEYKPNQTIKVWRKN